MVHDRLDLGYFCQSVSLSTESMYLHISKNVPVHSILNYKATENIQPKGLYFVAKYHLYSVLLSSNTKWQTMKWENTDVFKTNFKEWTADSFKDFSASQSRGRRKKKDTNISLIPFNRSALMGTENEQIAGEQPCFLFPRNHSSSLFLNNWFYSEHKS